MHLLANLEPLAACGEHSGRGFHPQQVPLHRLHRAVENVGLPDESGYKAGLRVVIDLHGHVQLFDHTAIHDGNAVGHGEGLLLVMGDIDEGDAQLFLKALELNLHLLAQLEIQGAQRLIQQQHFGVVDQGPCDGHPLLLPAGQGVRLALFKASQLHQGEHLGHTALDLVLGNLFDGQTVGHVVKHCHVGEQGVILEHGVHVPLIGLLALHPFPLHLDDAGGGILKPGDHPQGGGLAAAGGPQQGEELPLLDLHIHFSYH